MFATRPAFAALLFAAMPAAGHARSEPPDDAPTTAHAVAYPVAYPLAHTLDGLAASVPPHDATDFRLSVYTLSRGPAADTPAARLVPAGTAHDPARAGGGWTRRKMGFHYSSDGRLSGYLGTREPGSSPTGGPLPECCAAASGALPGAPPVGKHVEGSPVNTVLGQLRKRGLKLKLDDGWQLTSGAHSRQYDGTPFTSRIGHVTLGKWWGGLNTSYSMQMEKKGSTTFAPSQSLRVAYAFAPASMVTLAYTTGEEIAFFGERGLLKTEVRSVALRAEHGVRKEWALTLDAGYYDHGERLPAHKVVRVTLRRSL